MMKEDAVTRFLNFISYDRINGCWLWTGNKRNGYGMFRYLGRMVSAHRFSFELIKIKIPPRLELDHLCRVTNCVNPDHLEPVTQYVNNMRSDSPAGRNARAVNCPQGHVFVEHGYVNSNGRRECRLCKREYSREFMRQKRAGIKDIRVVLTGSG